MQMAKAYLKNIESLTNKDVMFRFLFKNFPDLENKSVLDLISQYELKNFFAGLSYDLIDIPEFYDYYKTEKDKEIL
ncbi:MAG: hypothetical protein LBU14_02115 [Candidatus Peribacteria bacterium]|jgi:hypothetical protein|nr:hypothetical protein [Candidatus Peribacteria bacterium]